MICPNRHAAGGSVALRRRLAAIAIERYVQTLTTAADQTTSIPLQRIPL